MFWNGTRAGMQCWALAVWYHCGDSGTCREPVCSSKRQTEGRMGIRQTRRHEVGQEEQTGWDVALDAGDQVPSWWKRHLQEANLLQRKTDRRTGSRDSDRHADMSSGL